MSGDHEPTAAEIEQWQLSRFVGSQMASRWRSQISVPRLAELSEIELELELRGEGLIRPIRSALLPAAVAAGGFNSAAPPLDR